MARAQFTLEFVLIFVAAFMIFLLLLVIAARFVDDIRGVSERDRIDTLAESLRRDLVLAKNSGTIYQSRVLLPATLDGLEYAIVIDQETLIVKATVDRPLEVHKKIPEIREGQFVKNRCNTINKDGTGDLYIAQVIDSEC
jgi:hypothetical protein